MGRKTRRIESTLDAWVDKAQERSLSQFRAGVWALFNELLMQTPQGSGRAVANWKIGLDAPDTSVETDVGDPHEVIGTKSGGAYVRWGHRKKGDPHWIEYARDQNRYLVQPGSKGGTSRIQSHTRVFFSNNVVGDTDLGESDEHYLASLQERDYWYEKLRKANHPYETVAETLIKFKWTDFKMGGSTNLDRFI